jgi:hypothetical protein
MGSAASSSRTVGARDITQWAEQWNVDPKPYVWTKTADDILKSLAAYCQRISDSAH